MRLTNSGWYVIGFVSAVLLGALLTWGHAISEYCVNERHAKAAICFFMEA